MLIDWDEIDAYAKSLGCTVYDGNDEDDYFAAMQDAKGDPEEMMRIRMMQQNKQK